ncbi:hypothetical protein L6452_18948 [Arctium lappa]|uniref:Uncharacterized protein n=1 Tax=Arctium lappa TaxID=4217 RepID=A0ACB9B6N4_ARCLA|nr:hypothetical protein L6452_18948 [Arctium lappa]
MNVDTSKPAGTGGVEETQSVVHDSEQITTDGSLMQNQRPIVNRLEPVANPKLGTPIRGKEPTGSINTTILNGSMPIRGILKNTNWFQVLGENDGQCTGESHVQGNVLPDICSRIFSRWGWLSNHACSDLGTRIIVAWDMRVMDVCLVDMHSQFMHVEIR